MAPVNVKKAAFSGGFYGNLHEKCGRKGAEKILNFNSDIVKG